MAVVDAAAAARLLDFTQPTDITVLEATVSAFYGAGSPEQQKAAERLLQQFQDNEQAWMRVATILDQAQLEQTKFFALQILEGCIKFRWGALPVEQREGIKTYVSNLIITYSTDERLFRTQTTFLKKLNLILVQILKQDWPAKWPNFIPDLVQASRQSETLCENSMVILKLLSEEIFDFWRGELTQAKTRDLKNQLNTEFQQINELCEFVLSVTQRPPLIRATLAALAAYLSWVPIGYIFQSNLLDRLLHLFPNPAFRNLSLQCLTEMAQLDIVNAELQPHYERFFKIFMAQLNTVMPYNTNVKEAYEQSNDEQQAFVQNLALFITGFLKPHIGILENGGPDAQAALIASLEVLVHISYVDDTEVFKTCLDFWHEFVPRVSAATVTDLQQQFSFSPAPTPASSLRSLYTGILSQLRALMIHRMEKPEEVIVVVDENGNAVRETLKDSDVLARYKAMRDTLVYLCHLDCNDTESQMLDKLRQQMLLSTTKIAQGQHKLDWSVLNTLCWAIGSISGSMQEEMENRFLVTVIRDLLNLCEVTKGKDNKAIIASNIMYVVGQYPKFLRAHWKFLKTVVNKLFEFMHETHPGVQDMACDTFLKICHQCRRKFVGMQMGEPEPFISELLNELPITVADLQPSQINTFYEAVGVILSSEPDSKRRDDYLMRLMAPLNTIWANFLGSARVNPVMMQDPNNIRSIQNLLTSNVSVCSSLGHAFLPQMVLIFPDMLVVYKLYSEMMSKAIAEGPQYAAKTQGVKYIRSIKKVVLKLIETFALKNEDRPMFASQFVPAMMDPILGDYARAVPDARDAEVLSVFAAIIDNLGELMEPQVPTIFEAVFQCTLDMITRNFEDHPDHRLKFFALLHAITNRCFNCLFKMSPEQLKMVINAIVWAFRHTERNVAETGLELLYDMLQSFARSEYATVFHQQYYLQLMQEIFAVMTDTFHKPGFELHAKILHHLFHLLSTDIIKAPLWDVASKGAAAYPNNLAFVNEYVRTLLAASFANMTPNQVQACVTGMFELQDFRTFKGHLLDFLVQSKSFASQDDADRFAEQVKAAADEERRKAALGSSSSNAGNAQMQDEMGG